MLYYLDNHNDIDTVIFCLDNDKAGVGNTAFLSGVLEDRYNHKYKINLKVPNLKDWNEDLIELAKKAVEIQNSPEDEWEREQ